MLDYAIVGGGLCGLALARTLSARAADVTVFEARERLGGRILTTTAPLSGAAFDLGPTWFWPQTQPLIRRLLSDLGLATFPQHDPGHVHVLRDGDKTAERCEGSVHGGAHRIKGGVDRLIVALAATLSPEQIRLHHVLTAIRDRGDHVALQFNLGEGGLEVLARAVVLAVPPRLIEEHLRFEPALDASTREAMRGAETWMASRAKVVIGYEQASWRAAGHSGNAFVTHEQAVLGEVFDACGEVETQAALGGFLALSPDQRAQFAEGLKLLIGNQVGQIFGPDLEHGEQYYQDWANEAFTCARRDRAAPPGEHAGFANPLLRLPL